MFQVHLHKRFFRIYSRLLFANNIRFVDLLCSSQKLVVPCCATAWTGVAKDLSAQYAQPMERVAADRCAERGETTQNEQVKIDRRMQNTRKKTSYDDEEEVGDDGGDDDDDDDDDNNDTRDDF